MATPEERDRQHEDERDAWQHEQDRIDRHADIPRDPTAAAEMILTTPLVVELTPRQIGRLLGLVAKERAVSYGAADDALLEDASVRLTRGVAQIGARP